MNSKAPFILGLIGVIVGAISVIYSIIAALFLRSTAAALGADTVPLLGAISTVSIVLYVIGIVIWILLLVFLLKTKKRPTRGGFIWFTVLSAIGLFTGLGIGAILCLIGGIIGIVKAQ